MSPFKFSLRRFLKFCVPKARFQEYRIFRSGICLMTYSEKTCFRAVRPADWSKTFLGQNQPFWLIHPVIYCFRSLGIAETVRFVKEFSRIILIIIMMTLICVSLFSFQSSLVAVSVTACLSYHKQSALSTTFLFFHRSAFALQLFYLTTVLRICQQLFSSFSNSFSVIRKRRRRDLNPRTAQTVYTLSRGASSAT